MEMQPPEVQSPKIEPHETGPPKDRETGTEKATPHIVDKYIVVLSKILFSVAGLGLVAMLVLVISDIIGIKIFSRPVPGGIEIVSFLAVVAIGFALPFTQVLHGNVAVDFVIEKVPPRPKMVVDVFTALLSVGLMVVLAYYCFKYAGKLRTTGEVSMTQKIPFYPFVYGLAFCFVVTTLVLIVQLIKVIVKAVKTWTP